MEGGTCFWTRKEDPPFKGMEQRNTLAHVEKQILQQDSVGVSLTTFSIVSFNTF